MGFGFASALFGQIDSKKPYLAQIGFFFQGLGQGLGYRAQIGLTLCFGLQTGSLSGCFKVVVGLFQGGPGRLLLIGCCRV